MIRESLWMLRKLIMARARSCRYSNWTKNLKQWGRFWSSYRQYNKLAPSDRQALLEHLYPCIEDETGVTVIEPTYFYQDWWAFNRIVKNAPKFHVDVGSHHKFVALLSTVIPVTMVDIRPLSLPLEGLHFRRGSILDLPFENESLESLSSLCVVEHIGLGRYGDALDPHGSENALSELTRVLAPAGRLYLSVPVGDRSIVAFNGGRIFALPDLWGMLAKLGKLEVAHERYVVRDRFQCQYQHAGSFGTTGLFELVKT
jgi:SAM-dependent methyltransferase